MESVNLKRVLVAILMILFLTNISFNFAPEITQASSPTTFFVDPPSIVDLGLTPGGSFTVDVRVSDAYYLYSWQVFMGWDGTILEATSVDFGGFLADQPIGSITAQAIEADSLLAAEVTLGAYPGIHGDGLLVTIVFSVLGTGETPLEINNDLTVYIKVTTPPAWEAVWPIRQDGYFSNVPAIIHQMIEEIETWDLPQGTKGSLVSKLESAIHLLEKRNENGAIHKLMDFINQVEAQRGQKLTDDQADYLTTEAQRITDLIEE